MSWTAFEFVSHVQGKQQLPLLRQIHYFCLRLHKWMGSPLCPCFYAKFQNFWQKRDLSKQVSCIFIGSSRPWRHFLIGNARKLLMSEKAVNVLMSTNSLVPQETAAWRNPHQSSECDTDSTCCCVRTLKHHYQKRGKCLSPKKFLQHTTGCFLPFSPTHACPGQRSGALAGQLMAGSVEAAAQIR